MKMSKSYGNYIAFNDTPKDIYGKVMSIPDALLMKYMRLLTEFDEETLSRYERNMREERVNPRDYKMELARKMVELLYNPEESVKAQEEFVQVFQKKNLPSDIPDLLLSETSIEAVDLLTKAGIPSRSEAKRLIQQGGVTLDDQKLEDPFNPLSLTEGMI